MTKAKREKLFLVLYLVLVVGFLIEAALPSDLSGIQQAPFTKIVLRLFDRGQNCTLTLEGGRDADGAALAYDEGAGLGSILRVYPAGGDEVISLESGDENVIAVKQFTTPVNGKLWLLIAKGAGDAVVTLTTRTDTDYSEKAFSFSVLPEKARGAAPVLTTVSSEVTVGERFDVSLADFGSIFGENLHTGVLFSSSDEEIAHLSSFDYQTASASFKTKAPGAVTVLAVSAADGRTLASLSVTVREKDETLYLRDADGEEIAEAALIYSGDAGRGSFFEIFPEGTDAPKFLTEDDGVVGVMRCDALHKTYYYLVALGAGDTTLTVTDGEGNGTDYGIHVSEAALPAVRVLSVNLPEGVAVGDLFDLSPVFDGEAIPLLWESDKTETAKLYSLSPETGGARFRADAEGDVTLTARDPVRGEALASVTVTIEKPRTERISFATFARKFVGHFLWCLAAAVAFGLAFREKIRNLWIFLASSLGASFLLGLLSEGIQYFIPSRGAAFTDVMIDTLGGAVGLVLFLAAFALIKIFRKRKTATE